MAAGRDDDDVVVVVVVVVRKDVELSGLVSKVLSGGVIEDSEVKYDAAKHLECLQAIDEKVKSARLAVRCARPSLLPPATQGQFRGINNNEIDFGLEQIARQTNKPGWKVRGTMNTEMHLQIRM